MVQNLTYSLQPCSINRIKENPDCIQIPTFVLLSCEKNETKPILEKIRLIPIVSDIKQVEGMYDVVIRLDSASFAEIERIIVKKIRMMYGVRTCITLQGAKSFDSVKRLWKQ